MAEKFQMRLVVEKIADPKAPVLLDKAVCIDVVFRGTRADVDQVAPVLRAFLDAGAFYGQWAGIGLGAYVDREITIA